MTKKILSLLVIISFCTISNSQISQKWTSNSAKIEWLETTSLGRLIVNVKDGLIGLDPETGNELWKYNSGKTITRETYAEIPGKAFLKIGTEDNFVLVNQFDGNEAFSTSKAGFKSVKDYYILNDIGAILVSGRDSKGDRLVGLVDLTSGKVNWTKNEDLDRICYATNLGNEEILFVTPFKNYKINSSSGETIWEKNSSSQADAMEDLGAFGDFLGSLATEVVEEEEDFDINIIVRQDKGDFYMYSHSEGESSCIGYNLETGEYKWDLPIEVKGKIEIIKLLNTGILIGSSDQNRSYLNIFNYETPKKEKYESPEGQLGKKGKGITLDGIITASIEDENGLYINTYGRNSTGFVGPNSKNFLNYFNYNSKELKFEKPLQFKGQLENLQFIGDNILYISQSNLNIFDSEGNKKFDDDIETNTKLTAQNKENLFIFDQDEMKLVKINKSSFALEPLSNDKIKFEGKEKPTQLELLGESLILSSSQNIAQYNLNGGGQYKHYFKAPKAPGWLQVLAVASAVYDSYKGAQDYMAAAQLSNASSQMSEDDQFAKELTNTFSQKFEERADKRKQYAEEAITYAFERKKATTSVKTFSIVLTKKDGDNVLLKIDKASGKEDGEINLGRNRNPNYTIDLVADKLYYQRGSSTIEAYTF